MRRYSAALLCLLFVPSLALAQGSPLLAVPDVLLGLEFDEFHIGRDECFGEVPATWRIVSGFVPCASPDLKVWLTAPGASCGIEPELARGDEVVLELDTSTVMRLGTGRFNLRLEDLPGFRVPPGMGASCPAAAPIELEHRLCASLRQVNTIDGTCTPEAAFVRNAADVKIVYDARSPQAPVLEHEPSVGRADRHPRSGTLRPHGARPRRRSAAEQPLEDEDGTSSSCTSSTFPRRPSA
jgi:hypothetical protein